MGGRLVLAGAGHAHLQLVRQAARLRAAGLEVTLIAPRRFHYSGLASGVLSGDLDPQAAGIDVAALSEACGVRHVPHPIVAIDRAARRLTLAGGATETYDRLSLNIGSVAADIHGLMAHQEVWPVKPLAALFALRARLETLWGRSRRAVRIVVAGGGHSALEIAASLSGLAERNGAQTSVTVIAPDPGTGLPPKARTRLLAALEARGVAFRTGVVVGRSTGECRLEDGTDWPCDVLVLAAGLAAPSLVDDLSLPVGRDGRLRVTPTLQSVGDPAIFAVGDCAVIEGHERPAAGVFGVRAAPTLLANLTAPENDRALTAYRPQARWLSIMDLGDGTGLAHRGGFWWLGRTSLRFKRYLDLGFVRRMRAPIRPTGDRS